MNRTDFQQLAELRLKEANTILHGMQSKAD
jgi:hypothetical protein